VSEKVIFRLYYWLLYKMTFSLCACARV